LLASSELHSISPSATVAGTGDAVRGLEAVWPTPMLRDGGLTFIPVKTGGVVFPPFGSGQPPNTSAAIHIAAKFQKNALFFIIILLSL
jgi:hypothetical protein